MKPPTDHIALAWTRYLLTRIASSNNLDDIHHLAEIALNDTDHLATPTTEAAAR